MGGSTPLMRRVPKSGFKNAFATTYAVVNVSDLEKHFDAGAQVDLDALVKVGLVRNRKLPVKVLGTGDLAKKLSVTAGKFSETAKAKIEKAGGSVTVA
jgi:large subunit ribosomal protein L15